MSVQIVKRGGQRGHETFSRDKLHHSIVAACLSVRSAEGSARTAADAVCKAIETWLRERPEVTSDDIRRVAARTLKINNPEAAYFYTHHKHIV